MPGVPTSAVSGSPGQCMHYKQCIYNGIVIGMRDMIAGDDSQLKQQPYSIKKKGFAVAHFGFTLGEIPKAC